MLEDEDFYVETALAFIGGVGALLAVTFQCLKIKSSKKDPAIMGVEGVISPIKDTNTESSSRNTLVRNGGENLTSNGHARTPSRAGGQGQGGDRKLPDIPRSTTNNNNLNDNQSDLYATVEYDDEDDEDEDDEDEDEIDNQVQANGSLSPNGLMASASKNSPSSAGAAQLQDNYHPYAKVKKTSKVEHPYATVTKKANVTSASDEGPASSASKRANRTRTASASSQNHNLNTSGGSNNLHVAPPEFNRHSRAGSSGRGSRVDLSTSSNSLQQHHYHNQPLPPHGSSRQTTPLPPEPPIPPPLPASPQSQQGGGQHQHHPQAHMQNPQQHFSGDSQDSSKGYTSITVREPARLIQIPQRRAAPAMRLPGGPNPLYATVSEASDEMYAAIEDPTYLPTTTSQSNSDTYAVIDLPEDQHHHPAVEMNPAGAASLPAQQSSRQQQQQQRGAQYHPYAKIQKKSKRPASSKENEKNEQPPPPYAMINKKQQKGQQPSGAVYARINKNRTISEDFDDEEDEDDLEDDGIPVGASAMHPSRQQQQSHHRHHYHNLSDQQQQPQQSSSSGRRQVDYSDFERRQYDKEAGYETVRDEGGGRLLAPPAQGGGANSSADGYETVPQYWTSANSGGYETVPGDEERRKANHRRGGGRAGGGGAVARRHSSRGASNEPGYEVVKETENKHSRSNSDPRYATVKNGEAVDEDVASDGYARVSMEQHRMKESPYATPEKQRNDNDSEPGGGYEIIPGAAAAETRRANDLRRNRLISATKSDFDPNYEVLGAAATNGSTNLRRKDSSIGEPNYEVVPDPETIPPPSPPLQRKSTSPSPSQPTSISSSSNGGHHLIHMSVHEQELPPTPGYQRRSSVVVIEHMEVSNVDDTSTTAAVAEAPRKDSVVSSVDDVDGVGADSDERIFV